MKSLNLFVHVCTCHTRGSPQYYAPRAFWKSSNPDLLTSTWKFSWSAMHWNRKSFGDCNLKSCIVQMALNVCITSMRMECGDQLKMLPFKCGRALFYIPFSSTHKFAKTTKCTSLWVIMVFAEITLPMWYKYNI